MAATQKGVDAHDSAGIAANAGSLKAQGYGFAAQYIDQNAATEDGPPGITPAQARSDIAAGLNLVSIYETSAMSSTNYQTGAAQYGWQTYLTRQQGQTDAAEAFASAAALGQPAGSAIYFAMDLDPAATQGISEAQALSRVDSYFQGIRDYVAAHPDGPSFAIGVYGAGDTLASVVRQNGLAQYGWLTQSTGWAGSKTGDANAQGWNLVQGGSSTFNGTAIDVDTATGADFGAWPVCFAAGTRIRVVRDGRVRELPIERLAVGDTVVTASGGRRLVRWLGHRALDCRHARRDVRPIRIVADAFAPRWPRRDLLVSPGHALAIGARGRELLIPAAALCNGATVAPIDVATVTYWHVELDGHDLLLAEGLATESYFEMGNRGFFVEAETTELAAAPDAAGGTMTRTHAEFCRPFHASGPLVEAARAALAERAAALGWRRLPDDLAGLHLLADGRRIEPVARGLALRFAVPAGGRDLRLVSRAARPRDVEVGADERRLGACIAELVLDEGFAPPRRINFDDPCLDAACGFHAAEAGWRWTADEARLPPALRGSGADAYLTVVLAMPGLPRWDPPAATAAGSAAALGTGEAIASIAFARVGS